MKQFKPMSEQKRHYVEMVLNQCGVTITTPYVLDMVCDAYELIRRKGGNSTISDGCDIERRNKQKHSILLSLVPDWYWDVD